MANDAQVMYTTPKQRERIVDGIRWTEEYKDRLKGLLELQSPVAQAGRTNQPVRALLLQDCYDGKDALAVQLGRDGIHSGFLVSILGDNNLSYTQVSPNNFTLKIIGIKQNLVTANDPADFVTLGVTSPIAFNANEDVFVTAFSKLDSRFSFENMQVLFGNPYIDSNLIPYGNIRSVTIDRVATLASPVGVWLIVINDNALPEYVAFDIQLEEVNASSLSGVSVEEIFDLPISDTTVVTDIDYRTRQYSWQAGTIVTCLDFMDIGLGIIRSSTRNLNTTVPAA